MPSTPPPPSYLLNCNLPVLMPTAQSPCSNRSRPSCCSAQKPTASSVLPPCRIRSSQTCKHYNQSQQHRHIPIAATQAKPVLTQAVHISLPLTACSQPHHFYHRRLFTSCLRALCRVMPSLQRCQAQPPIPSSVRVQSVRSSLAAVLSLCAAAPMPRQPPALSHNDPTSISCSLLVRK
ncbi:hypothetical protein M0R45_006876 [Rubus argutus]|uniref:Uncharacterized protein n=1 Tax=Rubus argutus TaxID=59490 RepID=A0AAW1YS68_RUBAR